MGLNWDSAQVHNHIAGTILQAGFGCDYTEAPGETPPLTVQLVDGDIDANMGSWIRTAPPILEAAAAVGDVVDLGLNSRAVEHSFLVPRYVIKSDAGRGIEPLAADLRSIDDLPAHAAVFRNPEQPDKGRFHNCIVVLAAMMMDYRYLYL